MVKRILFSFFLAISLFSCVSNEKVLSYIQENGNIMYHSMPVELKSKACDFFNIDFTFYSKNGKNQLDAVVNYSIVLKEMNKIDSVNVGLVVDGEKIYFKDKKILFKEVYKKNKKKVLVRFSSVLLKDDADKMTGSFGKIKFFVEADGFFEEIDSSDFNKQMTELRIMM